MPVNINEFKLFTEFISNKIQIGNTVSPTQFSQLANQAQLILFEKHRAQLLATGESSYFLDFFLKNKTTGVPSTGILPYPTDFVQTASLRGYYVPPSTGVGIEVPVEEVENTQYGMIASSQLMVPTKEFPKYSEFGTQFRFLPKNIGIVLLDYLRLPVAPVWGFTVVSNRPVYNPATSTDFEFDGYTLNAVAAIYLSFIGVNLKDGELSGFAEMFKSQTLS